MWQDRDVEVDQQTEPELRDLQTAPHLCVVNRMKAIDALQFRHQLFVDYQIQMMNIDRFPRYRIGYLFSDSNGMFEAASSTRTARA